MNIASSYRRPPQGSAGRRRLLAATALVIVIFSLDAISGGMLRNAARSLGAQIWNAGARTGLFVRMSGIFASRSALEKENASLREQLARAEARSAAFQALEDENRFLRAAARVAEEEAGITAPITSSLYSSPYGTFMVGAGAADGVAVGSLVMTADSSAGAFVVGRVSAVGAHTALVTELFAPNAALSATIRGASVELEGRGGGNARAQVPRTVDVAAGDSVTSASLGGRAIGVVGAVQTETSSAYSEVHIRLPINVGALPFVYVLSLRN